MKLWVDDIRPAPEGYVWAKSVNGAKIIITTCEMSCNEGIHPMDDTVEVIDIDHDAGDFAYDGGDYIKLLDWLEETGRNIPIRIHSMNPVGIMNMRRIIMKNGWKEVFTIIDKETDVVMNAKKSADRTMLIDIFIKHRVDILECAHGIDCSDCSFNNKINCKELKFIDTLLDLGFTFDPNLNIKLGVWEFDGTSWNCSICKEHYPEKLDFHHKPKLAYCPNCFAKIIDCEIGSTCNNMDAIKCIREHFSDILPEV